jgi:hypothetical protein
MTGHAKIVVGVICYAAWVIAWMLSRTVPWSAAPGCRRPIRNGIR